MPRFISMARLQATGNPKPAHRHPEGWPQWSVGCLASVNDLHAWLSMRVSEMAASAHDVMRHCLQVT